MMSFFRKNKVFLFLIIFVGVMGYITFHFMNTSAAMVYKLLTDSSTGITWQYGYDSSTNELEVSYFKSTSTFSSITIPPASFFINGDSNINTVKNYTFTNYSNHNLGTPGTFNSTVTRIDLSNVNVVNGLSPLKNNSSNVVIDVTLNPNSSKIGYDVFRELKINIHNLDKVTDIGGGAFYHTTFSNTELSLPNLKSLGNGSFETSNVTLVEINYENIGLSVFKNCKDLVSVVMLDNVRVINNSMFEGDSSLSSFDFNHVKTVNNDAFKDCTSWNIDIGDTEIEYLGTGVFWGTTGFTKEVTIPEKVTSIGWRTFFGSNISSIDLNNVKNIYSEAFKDCLKLSYVDFGKVEQINYQGFMNDSSLSSIFFTPSVYYIAYQAFLNCGLTSVDFGNVERIDGMAFMNNNITELYLPKSIVWLNETYIFANNPIEKITIAYDTLSTKMCDFRIVLNGFSSTVAPLKTLILVAPYGPNEDAVISSSHYDVSRKYRVYEDTAGTILSLTNGQAAYENNQEDIIYGKANLYKNVLQSTYFFDLDTIETVEFGEGYEFIGANSFRTFSTSDLNYWMSFYSTPNYPVSSNFSLSSIKLPSTLKGIGIVAFSCMLNRDNLSINLPESLEYIGRGAFRSCWRLRQEIDLPNLKFIGNCAFQGSGVSKIVLHDKLEKIGIEAFNFTHNLKEFIVDCDYFGITGLSDEYVPNHYYDGSYNNFNTTIKLYYSNINSDEYVLDLVKFTDKVRTLPKNFIPYQYTYNGRVYTTDNSYMNSLFWGIKVKTLDLEECPWTEMISHDFQEIMVETLKLPKNLTKINDEMFYKARVVNPVEIPDSVTSIGKSAFAGSNIIISNGLPSGLKTIGDAAFYNSKINDNLVIPSSVTSIGKSAFATCPSDYAYSCVPSYTTWNNDLEVHRNSITFESSLSPSVMGGQSISQLLWNSTVDNLIFGDNVTELPTKTLNEGKSLEDVSPEFWNIPVKKVTFKNLVELPKKAFIDNTSLEEVDFLEDPNLSKLDDYSFLGTSNLKKVKLYHDLNFDVGSHAFLGSGLTTLGNEYSDFDIVNHKINLTGDFTFSYMPNLEDVRVTGNLNNGIIPKGTFYSDKLLEKVILEDDVKELKQEAFGADDGLKTFVMYGDTKIYGKDKNQKTTLKDIDHVNIHLDTEETEFTVKVNDTTISVSDFIDNKYVYNTDSEVILESTGDVILDKVSNDTIYVRDVKNDYLTISATANLYCYLMNEDCNDYKNTYEELKNSYETDLYYLDEVLYLDSNKVTIDLTEDKKDIEKEGLILYALRRDGVILVSEEWGKMTDAIKYVDSGVTIRNYNADTDNPRLMVFNTSRKIEDLDTTTNDNFKNVTYEMGIPNPETGKVDVDFVYENVVVHTTAATTLKTETNYVEVTYSDGCGGESFANVIFENIILGGNTPQFTGGTPKREGYEFVGWDKEISPTVDSNIIYTAVWRKIEVNNPDIIKDIPGQVTDSITNPYTHNNLKLFILFVILLLGSMFGYKKLKEKH